MNYSDIKFAASIKDSPYMLYLEWDQSGMGIEYVSYNYVIPENDFSNFSIFSDKKYLEKDLALAAQNGLDLNIVEILEVEINYTIKKNKTSIDEKQEIS